MTESGKIPPVPETYYDPQTQRLVIGRAALNAEMASQEMGDYDFETPPESDTPASYTDLPELLTSKQNVLTPSDTSFNTWYSRFSYEDILQLGTWAYKHIQQAGGTTIHGGHFHRLHLIGLGPARRVIFGKVDMRNLRDEIQVEENRHLANVSNWTKQDWQQYAKRVHAALPDGPRPPEGEDYDRLAPEFNGPARHTIWRHLGGIGALNELIGYADISNWDEEDVIDWGVRVLQANPDQPAALDQKVLRILSRRKAGPSYEYIRKVCGSFPDFQERARRRLQEQYEAEQLRVTRQLRRFEEIVQFPRSLNDDDISPDHMSQAEKLAFTAKYDVAMKLLNTGNHEQAWRAARLGASEFTSRIRYLRPGIKKGDIELEASLAGTMDDIWTPDRELDALIITQEEIDSHNYRKKRAMVNQEAVGNTATIKDVRREVAEAATGPAQQGLNRLVALRRRLASVREQYSHLLENANTPGSDEPVAYMTQALDMLSDEVISKLEAGIAATEEIERRL